MIKPLSGPQLRLEDQSLVFPVTAAIGTKIHTVDRTLSQSPAFLQNPVPGLKLQLIRGDAAQGCFHHGLQIQIMLVGHGDILCPGVPVPPGLFQHIVDFIQFGVVGDVVCNGQKSRQCRRNRLFLCF